MNEKRREEGGEKTDRKEERQSDTKERNGDRKIKVQIGRQAT